MSNDQPIRESAEEIIFDANLQEFATKIGFICSLESSGKVAPADAYKQIKDLWKALKASKHNLNIGAGEEASGGPDNTESGSAASGE